MYKCIECGHLFDEGEEMHYTERHGFTDGRYEEFSGCPVCGCAYEETVFCDHCDGRFLEDELLAGHICRNCVEKQITIPNVKRYIEECGIEEDFYISHYMDSVAKKVSPLLMKTIKNQFVLLGLKEPQEALKVCESFVMEDEFSMADFADWLDSQNKEKEKICEA